MTYAIEMTDHPNMDNMADMHDADRHAAAALVAENNSFAATVFPSTWAGVPLGLVEWMMHNRRTTS